MLLPTHKPDECFLFMMNDDSNQLTQISTGIQSSAQNCARKFIRMSILKTQALQSTMKKEWLQKRRLHSCQNSGLSKRSHITLGLAGLVLLQGMQSPPAEAASATKTGQRVLMIEMTPALCSLQPSRTRMRQCLEGYSLTVSGLDMGYGERCGRGSDPRLTPLQLKVVNRIMPDTTVRSQAWQHYGACSPLSASSYFRQITNYAGALKLPTELNTGNSYTVSKSRFISQMTRLNSGMSSASIDLICQDGSRRQSVLTDIHVCYDGGQFGRCNDVVNNCGNNFIISGGR